MKSILTPLLFLCLGLSAHAQNACPPLQAPTPDPQILITPRQEMELGEILRQQLEGEFQVVDDKRLTGYLIKVGNSVAAQLPDVGLHYTFLVYDLPEIQAFGMPGGRIYVSRKMASFLHSEDELAGVLGHEMGHMVARQQAAEVSRQFREILGIKTLPENEDLFALYNQLIETTRLKKRRPGPSGEESRGQMTADELGMQATARAGYSVQAFPDFLDRLMQTKGKTGNWFSDLFGSRGPDSKRLREALNDLTAVPKDCLAKRGVAGVDEFAQWQAAVLRYRGVGHAENLRGVVDRKVLKDPLRGDITCFQYSKDGTYILAQDEGGIYVLTRDPFEFIFRIDAPEAEDAQFTPDGKSVAFFDTALRVETWNIEKQEQSSITDVPTLRRCRQTALSPDAKFLACFQQDMTLTLFNVTTGESVFQKEKFYDFDPGMSGHGGLIKFFFMLRHHDLVTLRYSPDAHYFAAGSATGEAFAVELNTAQKVSLSSSLRNLMTYSFTFLGPDKILGEDTSNPKKSAIVDFPSGKTLDHVELGGTHLNAASNPRYVLLRPLHDNPAAVLDMESISEPGQRKVLFTNRNSAIDVWGQEYVSERLNGEVGRYEVTKITTDKVLQLPLGKLGGLQTAVASPDLEWLAISTGTRGGVWNVNKNERPVNARGFSNASYTNTPAFFLDFPEFEKVNRKIVIVSPVTQQSRVREIAKEEDLRFFGDTCLHVKHNDNKQHSNWNVVVDALDLATLNPLWSRNFPKQGPTLDGTSETGKLLMGWKAQAEGLKDEIARDPKLQARWPNDKPGEADYFLEVLNARDGTTLGSVYLRTGKYSFVPEYWNAAGEALIIADNRHRVLLYSSATGEQRAKWFGDRPRLSRHGDRLCLANGRAHLLVYDVKSLKLTNEYFFAEPVMLKIFSEDGKRLLVMTSDQTLFLLDLALGETTPVLARQ
jgi:WD40 repeat protein